MKDLFVELTHLSGQMGTVAAVAVALREEMLNPTDREADLEKSLSAELGKLAEAASRLALDIRDRNVGVSFTGAELDDSTPARRLRGKGRM